MDSEYGSSGKGKLIKIGIGRHREGRQGRKGRKGSREGRTFFFVVVGGWNVYSDKVKPDSRKELSNVPFVFVDLSKNKERGNGPAAGLSMALPMRKVERWKLFEKCS